MIGNVGFLQAGIELFPDARPDDGVLDVILASPRTLRDWARILTTVLAVRGTDEHLVRRRGKRISITAEEPVAYQLDGDTIGHARRLVASVDAQALTLRVPDQSYERHNPLGNLRRSAPNSRNPRITSATAARMPNTSSTILILLQGRSPTTLPVTPFM